ncbi:MAG: P1 family peptidase [Deltaproteobacteria bacterium]|nr:P1 family peptidase [Deltaproteobacteria bacterium]
MRDPHLETPTAKRRARALGIPFVGVPGPHNAITDVAGVEVGYRTLVSGAGALVVGKGPVRTGVTAILPRGGDDVGIPVFAGVHSLNGNGEMTGFVWIEECGRTDLPILITNTHSVGLARDAVLKWMIARHPARMPEFGLPVVAETYDGQLNDINGFHLKDDDVFKALDDAAGGPIDEGSVGGGTGMVCYEHKGGSGTASRVVVGGEKEGTPFRGTVGAFVQANFGRREQLTIAGVPVGRWLMEAEAATSTGAPDAGSIIVVVATDLPLVPHQLKRLARRVGLGIGRSGGIAGHGSGDIFLAFSTANAGFFAKGLAPRALTCLPDEALSPVFSGVIQSVDEAILNALIANEDMRGINDRLVPALPHAPVEQWVKAMLHAPPLRS